MADIFLSYAREDRQKAERLAKALEGQGWSVFWDLKVPAGLTWDEYIGGELERARCVVVTWSSASVGSRWVREEAREGRTREILVPAFLEEVQPPFGFRGVQAVNLAAWDGDPRAELFKLLAEGVERILGQAPVSVETEARGRKQKQRQREAEARPLLAEAVRPESEDAMKADERLNRQVRIEGGDFLMGSPEGRGSRDEHPQHLVRVTSFCLQEHPVTNREYLSFKPEHKFSRGKENHPVVGVTWQDAADYAEKLGGRLPTEAEWEYACRAGTETAYWSGDSREELARVGWYYPNSGGRTHSVRAKAASPWGLYDMHGNIWEWVSDWYDKKEYRRRTTFLEPEQALENPERVSRNGSGYRVIRGGSFKVDSDRTRSAFRGRRDPWSRRREQGFRVAFDAAPSKNE